MSIRIEFSRKICLKKFVFYVILLLLKKFKGQNMNEFQTYEIITHQKSEGIWIFKRIALILLYIAYVITAFTLGVMTRIIMPLLALVPVSTCILVFFTWRYVDVDYECSMTSGVLTFSKIFASRSRKAVFEINIKSISHIAPYLSDSKKRIDRYAPEVIYDARSSQRADRQYFALFENADGKKSLFLFEPDDKMLKILKFYNASAMSSERSR